MADNRSFSQWLWESGVDTLASSAFSGMSGMMRDASRKERAEQDKASKKVTDTEEESDKPKGGSSRTTNAVTNQLVLDTLDSIDSRLETQNIILNLSLTEQVRSTRLLEQLVGSGGSGGFGGGGGSGGGGSLFGGIGDAIEGGAAVAGGAGILNFIKRGFGKLVGGASSLAGSAGEAVMANPEMAGLIAAAVVGVMLDKKIIDDSKDPTKTRSKDTQDEIDRIKRHLELNPTDPDAAKMKETLDKLNKNLEKEKENEKKTLAGEGHGIDIDKYKKDKDKENKDNIDLPPFEIIDVSPKKDTPQFPQGNLQGIPLSQGETAADIAKRGGFSGGQMVGGGGQVGDHPGGVGGYRSQGTGAQVSRGQLAKNQQIAYQAFLKEGLSDSAARIAVANLSGESLGDPSDVHPDPSRSNPNQVAQGAASWDDPRSQRIFKQFGKFPKDMNVEESAKAFAWEMKNFYPNAWKDLNNESLPADQRMYSVVKGFENPRSPEADTESRLRIMRGLNVNPQQNLQGFSPPKNTSEVLGHLADAKSRGLITNDQCVSLASAAVGIPMASGMEGSHVNQWLPGQGAMEGNLKPGTPIATFLDRQGRSAGHYAQGSLQGGDPGAGLDHAAVFDSYIRDKVGKIVGMNVNEQYAASHGEIRQKQYKIGGGFGEADASNYHAIMTAQGYLGGKNNPMTSGPDIANNQLHDRDLSKFPSDNTVADADLPAEGSDEEALLRHTVKAIKKHHKKHVHSAVKKIQHAVTGKAGSQSHTSGQDNDFSDHSSISFRSLTSGGEDSSEPTPLPFDDYNLNIPPSRFRESYFGPGGQGGVNYRPSPDNYNLNVPPSYFRESYFGPGGPGYKPPQQPVSSMKPTRPDVSNLMVQKSNEQAVIGSLQAQAQQPIVQQFNQQAVSHPNSLTGLMGNDRANDKSIGPVAPPDHRLMELFTSQEAQKGF